MKKIMVLLMVACAVQVIAGPEVMPVLTCSGVTTSTVPITATTEIPVSGYIKGIQISVSPADKTCTVTIASSGVGGLSARTFYSTAAATGSTFIYPMAVGSTNGVDVAEYVPVFLCNDKLTVSAHTATEATTISVSVTPVIDRK